MHKVILSLLCFAGWAYASTLSTTPVDDPLLDQMQVWAHYPNGQDTVAQYLSTTPTVTTVGLLGDNSIWALSFWNTVYPYWGQELDASLLWNGGTVVRSITNGGTGAVGFEMDLPKNEFSTGSTPVTFTLSIGNAQTTGTFNLLVPAPEVSNWLVTACGVGLVLIARRTSPNTN